MVTYFKFQLQEIKKYHKHCLIVVTTIFIASIIAGFYVPAFYKYTMISGFSEKATGLFSENLAVLSWNIFINNAFVGLLLMFFCITIFIPSLILFANGLLIGSFLEVMYTVSYIRDSAFILPLLASLVPHGVLELPAIIISCAISTSMGVKLFFRHRYAPSLSIRAFYKKSLVQFFTVVIPMLFVAAFVEGCITPILANMTLEEKTTPQEIESLQAMIVNSENIPHATEIQESDFIQHEAHFQLPFEFISYLPFIVDTTNREEVRNAQPTIATHQFFQNGSDLITISLAKHSSEQQAQKNKLYLEADFPFPEFPMHMEPKRFYQHIISDEDMLFVIRSNSKDLLDMTAKAQEEWLRSLNASNSDIQK